MLHQPKRQRILNFNPGISRPSFLSVRTSSKNSSNSLNNNNIEFSFNLDDTAQREDQDLYDSGLGLVTAAIPKRIVNNLYTINPERSGGRHKYGIRHDSSPRRQQGINPNVLRRPIMQEIANQDLFQKGMNQHQTSFAGNLTVTQRPLQLQSPNQIQIIRPSPKVSPMSKIQQNDSMFNEIKKLDSISFSKQKSKMLPTLSRMGVSEPDGLLKLAKKISGEDNSSNLQFQTKKQTLQGNKSFIQYGHFLADHKLTKIKAQINQFVIQKSKNKPKINYTNQTRIQDALELQSEFKRPNSNMLFGQTVKNNYGSRINDYKSFSSPKQINEFKQKVIKVSYKTSLSQLKDILRKVSQKNLVTIQVLVPKILMGAVFDQSQQKNDLYNQAKFIFASLGIPSTNLTIKKYSNCIVMVSKNICLLWHFEGKVYLGGWQTQYLDEGSKNGVGLQWVPNKYVYYGEFYNSKRSGLGILKTRQETFIGEWQQGKKTQNGHIINSNGEIFHPRLSYEGGTKQSPDQQSLESDPFL